MQNFYFTRRLGILPQCNNTSGCPDILELDGGDFAVIGTDITDAAREALPEGSGCADSERIVKIPRKTLVDARRDIPAD